jgi:hypothetical protein
MAKRKGVETKAALLQQHFKGDLKKVDEAELDDWCNDNLQKNRDYYSRQYSPWAAEGLSPLDWFDRKIRDREEKLQEAA